MRKQTTLIALVAAFMFAAPAVAQDDPAPAAEAPAAEAPPTPTEAEPAPETPATAPEGANKPGDAKAVADGPDPGSNEDLAAKAKEVKGAVDELRGDSATPRKFLIAALIAAICNLLLSAIKRGLKLDKGKKWLPRIALGLGVVVGVTTYFVPGTTLVEALIYGGGPPGAIIIQEIFPLLRSKEVADV